MKQIKSFTFAEVLAQIQAQAIAADEAFHKMTPAEQAEYIRKCEADQAEAQEILAQLRGPGFTEIQVGKKGD